MMMNGPALLENKIDSKVRMTIATYCESLKLESYCCHLCVAFEFRSKQKLLK